MKSLLQYIALTLCLLLPCAVRAQVGGEASFSLREGPEGAWRVEFRLGRWGVDTVAGGYSRIVAAGLTGAHGAVGCPSLPTASRLVVLPRGSRLALAAVEGREVTLDGAIDAGRPLHPVAAARPKDAPPAAFDPDAKIYGSAQWYRGGEPLELEHVGTMGGSEVFRLTVRPVAYQPASGALRLYERLEARLEGAASGEGAAPSRRYLIVSRPQFREGLQPFVHWKRQQGYEVVERYADTNSRAVVKGLIDAEFAEPDRWPGHLLLVGDVAQLQAFLGTTRPSDMGQHITDLYYAEHTGDYLPDALVGRWPVNDSAELGAVVRKSMAYEQGRLADSAALRRLLLVAGAESTAPAPTTTNGQVNYLGREIKLAHPAWDTLCYRNPASGSQREAILTDLRQGVAAVNYTAHCTAAGWSSPAVSFTSIDTLGFAQPMLYVNNCCLSNEFGGTCFGEQLLRAPAGGAIGVVGATNSTLWDEDYYWAVGPKLPLALEPLYDSLRPGAFDRWLGRAADIRSQGQLLTAGNLAVTAVGSPYDKFYWEIYCLLGDPSLEPWVGVPPAVDLHLAAGLPRNGAGTLHLGGTPGATVTAMQHDSVLGCGTIGADGLLALPLSVSIDTTALLLTATRSGYIPRIDTVVALPAEGMAVALREVTVGDSTVGCRLENVGTLPLYGLRVVLSQLEADSLTDALVEERAATVDTLMPQHSSPWLTLPLHVSAVGQTPGWEADLTVWDSVEGMLCHLVLQGRLSVAYPSAEFRLLEADGSESHSLQPQRGYLLETLLAGMADSLALRVTALPSEDVLIDTTFHSPLPALHSPLTTPGSLTHLRLQATLRLGNYRSQSEHYLTAGRRDDSFEAGMGSYPWLAAGTAGWQVDSTVARSGRYSLRSGAIGHRQTSDLVLEVWLPVDDTLRYWSRISSEPNADKLLFSVDGQSRANARWGSGDWKQQVVTLGAGRHTLRWRYVKDDSVEQGSDCAWLDDVQLPMAVWDAPYGWFGSLPALAVESPEDESARFRVYPNPTTGRFGWSGEGVRRMTLRDLYGREVLTLEQPLPTTVDLSSLPDGLYLLQVATDHDTYHVKLLIRH